MHLHGGFYLRFLALFILFSSELMASPAADNIIISEVQYDPATPLGHTSTEVENEAEWFELFNPTSTPVDIGNWTIKEGSTPIYTFPNPTVIAAGDYLLVTNRSDRFNLNYPLITPDLEMQPGGSGLLKLNNGGDQLTLKNDVGATVDFVAWEGFVATWNAQQAGNGETICRILNTDTDTGIDWGTCAATPGTGPGFTLSKFTSSIDEGSSDTFTVVLDTQPANTVVINITSNDIGAVTTSSTSLTFTNADWDTPQVITINGIEDSDLFDESVTITASIDAALSDDDFDGLIDQTVSVSIADNDEAQISINDVTHIEADSGTTDYIFTISIDQISPDDISVDYINNNISATAADNDFNPITTTTATILAGSTSARILVQSLGDVQVESDESFSVDLSNPVAASILDAQGIATISNDDSTQISINDISENESDSGNVSYIFTISINNPSDTDITVDYATADGSLLADGSATAVDNDYITIPITQAIITAGSLSTQVVVQVIGDNTVEENERFFVNLSNSSGAGFFNNQGIGTIVNDDQAQLSIDDVTHNEGDSGNTSYTFTISIDNPSNTDITVDYETADGSLPADDSATTADSDYIGIVPTQATISAGETSTTIIIQTIGDTQVENNERFFINLSNSVGATIIDAQGIASISNDDAAGFSISPTTVDLNEGETATFSLVLTAQPINDVVIDLNSADTGAANISTSSISFDNSNWNIPQQVTITAIEDADLDNENTIITASINDASSDDLFDSLANQTVNVNISDDDVDTDGDGVADENDLDKDNDGNPDSTDPNPLTVQVSDNFIEIIGVTDEASVTLDILSNDDFIPSADISIIDTGNGTALGEVSFDPVTGDMTYTAAATEKGSTITVEYQVCNTAVTPEVCGIATVTITIVALPILPPSTIPTLSDWMLFVLSILLLSIGIRNKPNSQSKNKM
ncbi:MAG: lamin tail domain-containing protein [Cocleimonas sp.]